MAIQHSNAATNKAITSVTTTATINITTTIITLATKNTNYNTNNNHIVCIVVPLLDFMSAQFNRMLTVHWLTGLHTSSDFLTSQNAANKQLLAAAITKHIHTCAHVESNLAE